MKLTVYFDLQCQFWVGIIESEENNKLKAARFIFGKEPKEAEILEFINFHMLPLINRVTQTIQTKLKDERRINPKRLIRLAAKELQQHGASTYAQDSVKLELENRKKESKKNSRQDQEEIKERKYELKSQKAKLKHRGK
ncbi:MAG: hypothetical protein K0Q87_4540 [Neobacillus sp.]|jgi:hypothetical protein|nr:hypothetical protein [Neobacillus sp.]